MINLWDETDCVFALAPNAWSKGNGQADQNTGNFPSYPNGAWQNCVLTNMGAGFGYIYNNKDGYLNFDSTNDEVLTAHQHSHTNASGFTVESKLNLVQDGGTMTIADQQQNVNSRFQFGLLAASYKMYCSWNNGAGLRAVISTPGLTNGLHTVHYVKDGINQRLYIDGVEVAAYDQQDTYNLGNFTPNNFFIVGNRFAVDQGWNDRMYWFAAYDTALSDARILYNHNLPNDMSLIGENSNNVMGLRAPANTIIDKIIRRQCFRQNMSNVI